MCILWHIALTLNCANYFIARRQIRCYRTVTLCNRGLRRAPAHIACGRLKEICQTAVQCWNGSVSIVRRFNNPTVSRVNLPLKLKLTLTLFLTLTDTGDLRTIEPSDYRAATVETYLLGYRVRQTDLSFHNVCRVVIQEDISWHFNI